MCMKRATEVWKWNSAVVSCGGGLGSENDRWRGGMDARGGAGGGSDWYWGTVSVGGSWVKGGVGFRRWSPFGFDNGGSRQQWAQQRCRKWGGGFSAGWNGFIGGSISRASIVLAQDGLQARSGIPAEPIDGGWAVYVSGYGRKIAPSG